MVRSTQWPGGLTARHPRCPDVHPSDGIRNSPQARRISHPNALQVPRVTVVFRYVMFRQGNATKYCPENRPNPLNTRFRFGHRYTMQSHVAGPIRGPIKTSVSAVPQSYLASLVRPGKLGKPRGREVTRIRLPRREQAP